MSSLVPGLQKRSFSALPVSQSPDDDQLSKGLRKRLSSLSFRIQPSVAFRSIQRSKSVPGQLEDCAVGMGVSIRKWWEWGWGWILSRKPSFAMDLEMNPDETKVLGSHNKGSWRHLVYKVRSEIRKVVAMRSDRVGLPQTYRYDSSSYSKNFDHGNGNGNGNGIPSQYSPPPTAQYY